MDFNKWYYIMIKCIIKMKSILTELPYAVRRFRCPMLAFFRSSLSPEPRSQFSPLAAIAIPLFLFLSSPLFPEENRSSYIRTLLDRRDLSAARSELDRHLKDSPNDPSVKFLQTELLIAESEAAESRGDIKTALEKLEKVIPEYPKHSNVVLRYEDLMKRKQNGGLNGIPNIILSGSPANTSLSERVAKLEEAQRFC